MVALAVGAPVAFSLGAAVALAFGMGGGALVVVFAVALEGAAPVFAVALDEFPADELLEMEIAGAPLPGRGGLGGGGAGIAAF